MSLTILQIAYAFGPVTADPPGGAEQVLAALDRALVEAGHRSIVIAPEGSQVAGKLLPIPAPGRTIDDAALARAHAAIRDHIARLIERDRPDLIHLHGLDFGRYLPPPGPPVLVTLHMPLGWYEAESLQGVRPRTHLLPVSASQAALAPPGMRLLDPIANGVDLARYRPGPKSGPALILGRVAEEKGFHDALAAARLAGMPLDCAGKVFPYEAHQLYFRERVEPLLDGERRWLGEVSGAAKAHLLASARCVLIPSTAPETSSLVAMEALASGTPVIAYRAGALPDIVEDGVTGLLVDGAEEMAKALHLIDRVDPVACRRAAETRFPLSRATDAYLALYARLAA